MHSTSWAPLNGILIVEFFNIQNSTISEGSMNVKLDLMLDHGMKRVSKSYTDQGWVQAGPMELDCTSRRTFSPYINIKDER